MAHHMFYLPCSQLLLAGFFQGTAIVARQPAAARPAFAPLAVRYVSKYLNIFISNGGDGSSTVLYSQSTYFLSFLLNLQC
jgi:hypothetical protein